MELSWMGVGVSMPIRSRAWRLDERRAKSLKEDNVTVPFGKGEEWEREMAEGMQMVRPAYRIYRCRGNSVNLKPAIRILSTNLSGYGPAGGS